MSEIECDVVVVGGGTSGVIAAIAASRAGAKTVLVEKYGFLGGVASFGIPFLAFIAGDGTRVVDGIPNELVNKMVAFGGCPGHVRGGKWKESGEHSDYEFALTPYDPEVYKYTAMKMVLDSGVDLLLHSYFSDVKISHGEIECIEIVNKSGKQNIKAKIYVDATGDADIAYQAGFDYRKGDEQGSMQNVSDIFNMGRVDTNFMVEALKNRDRILGWGEWYTRIVKGEKLEGEEGYVHIAGHMQPWEDESCLTFTAVSYREGEVSLNITRTVGIDGTEATDLTKGETCERENVFSIAQAMRRNVPGFERSYLISTSPQIGIRESRNIIGEYVMTVGDVLGCRGFDDNIARGCYPVDIHDPHGGKTQFQFLKDRGSYGVPYRALIPKGAKNVIMAGRCISTDHEAHGTVRIMSTAMATGQAAGAAAALAAKRNSHVMDLDIVELRELLSYQNAILDVDDVIYDDEY
ncbi:MAG: FAD-dependent oxidoreductase [Clostridia bacterium]|nr:FAD-dependent oxidoreductase [Clostridia bacterium]